MAGPPAGENTVVGSQGVGEADEVGQDASERVVPRAVLKEVDTDARQPVQQVVLGESRKFAPVDTGFGAGGAAVGEAGDGEVDGGEGGCVAVGAVLLSGVQHEGDGGEAVAEPGGLGGADVGGRGRFHPRVGCLPAAAAEMGAFDVQNRDARSPLESDGPAFTLRHRLSARPS